VSILDRIVRGNAESRSTLSNPSQWLIESLAGGQSTYSGKTVTGESALSLVPVMAASQLVASAVGGVPMKVYRDDRTDAKGTRQWRILHDQPNDEMAADELWELVAHHLLVWGNAFLLKDRDEFGLVQMLWPIAPARMEVGRENQGDRALRYFKVDGQPKRYYEQDILHIRGLGSDGLIGYSVVQMARQQLGNMLAQDEFSGRFWANGTFLGAALSHPGEMSEPAQKRLRKQMTRKKGVAEANGIWVFEEDMKYQSVGMPLRDAQWLEQTQMSDTRVAQMFGLVPPHRWGMDAGNLTYANTEVAGTEFVRWTGRKWWTRIEKSIGRDPSLFPPSSKLYAEFLTADLMRGDTKSRFETYEIGIRSKVLTRNEARAAENLAPVEGGDEFLDPTQAAPDPSSPPAAEAPADTSRTFIVNVPPDDTRSRESFEQLATAIADAVEEREAQPPPVVNVIVPTADAPIVNVTAAASSPDVIVNVPDSPAPEVRVDVHPTPVTVDAPVTVNVPPQGERKVTFQRDRNGEIKTADIEDQKPVTKGRSR
jgi:HK97 family phage portal protein